MSNKTQTYADLPPPAGILVVHGTLIPLSVLGIFTNTVTIIVIFTSSKLKSTFNYFIASLAVSDMTSAVISVIFLYRLTWGFVDWKWPEFLCGFFWALDIWTSYVTSSHILLFSLLRFVSIRWPTTFKAITLTHARICIVCVWLLTGLVGAIPFGIWFKPVHRNGTAQSLWASCFVHPDEVNEFRWYTRIMYPIFFYIPIILISTFSISIGINIFIKRKARNAMIGKYRDGEFRRRKKENQILLQLGLIVGSYLLGYITYSVYHLTTIDHVLPTPAEAVTDYWFGFVEYLMLRVSECLNPIFYNLASSVMRRETKSMFKGAWMKVLSIFCCKQPQLNTSKKSERRNPTDELSI